MTVVAAAGRCPSCDAEARHHVCGWCGLRLACPACRARLADPLHQRTCDVCRSPLGSSEDPSASPTARGSVPVRRAAVALAEALLGEGRGAEAASAVAVAAAEDADDPPQTEVLVLRARCARWAGRPDEAAADLLDAVRLAPELLHEHHATIATLLLAHEAARVRRDVLGRWGPTLRDAAADARAVAAIELTAAVLERDEGAASSALARLDGPTAAATLRDVRRRAPADADGYATLAHLEASLGLRDEALEDARRALDLEDPGPDRAPARIVLHDLVTSLLDPVGDRDELLATLTEAGWAAYDADRDEDAERFLRQAIRVEDRAVSRWLLADVARQRAVPAPDPARRAELLVGARADWEAGRRLAEPARDTAWAWSTLALIERATADADPATGALGLLRTVGAIERRLLLGEPDDLVWTTLMLACIDLGLPALVAECVELGEAGAPDPATAVPTSAFLRAAVATQLGRPEADPWARCVADGAGPTELRAAGLALSGAFTETLALLADTPEQERSEPLLAHRVAAFAHARLGRDAEARAEFVALLALLDAGDPRLAEMSAADRAAATFWAGRPHDALRLVAPLALRWDLPPIPPLDTVGLALLCEVALGDPGAAHARLDALRASVHDVFAADDLLDDLRRVLAGSVTGGVSPLADAESAGLLAELEAVCAAIRTDVDDPRRVVAVLRARCALLPADARAEEQGLALAQTRVLLRAGHWADLADACAARLEDGGWSAAERAGLVERLLAGVGALLRDGRDAAAAPALQRAARTLAGTEDAVAPALHRVVVGLRAGDAAAVRAAARDAAPADPADLAALVRGLPDVRALAEALRVAGASTDDPLLLVAADRVRDELFGLGPTAGEWRWPWATPIRLDIAPDLVPDDVSETGPMLGELVPALRTAVRTATGLPVPGVRIRECLDLPAATCRIRIGDGLPAMGRAEAGAMFVPHAREVVEARLGTVAGLVEVEAPTGRRACWLPLDPTDDGPTDGADVPVRSLLSRTASWISGKAGEWWRRRVVSEELGGSTDPLAHPFWLLEARVLAAVPRLVTTEVTATLLDEWRAGGQLGTDGVDSRAFAPRLTTLLRDVVERGRRLVPVGHLDAVLDAAADPHVAHQEALVRCLEAFPSPRTDAGAAPAGPPVAS